MRHSLKDSNAVLSAEMASKSKWSVGSSNSNVFFSSSIIFENIARAFSPPDNTVTSFFALSPENNMRPKKPRNISVSFFS